MLVLSLTDIIPEQLPTDLIVDQQQALAPLKKLPPPLLKEGDRGGGL